MEETQSSAKDGSTVDADKITRLFAMDCITQVAFGIKVDAVKNPDTDFMKKCDVMFETWRFMIVALFTAVHGGLQGQVQLLFFFF